MLRNLVLRNLPKFTTNDGMTGREADALQKAVRRDNVRLGLKLAAGVALFYITVHVLAKNNKNTHED